MIRYCVVFILSPFCFGQDEARSGVAPLSAPDDFQNMLRNPATSPSKGESFATYVTRPFVDDLTRKTEFFSDPRESRPQWDSEYKNWSTKTRSAAAARISALGIFETIGVSRRGLTRSGNDYTRITDAQREGMVRIVAGQLGFRSTPATEQEKSILAREFGQYGSIYRCWRINQRNC